VQAIVGVIAAVTHVAFPLGAVLDIVLAIAKVTKPDIDKWYDDVVASVDRWADSHPDLMTPVGGLRTGWGERFVAELDSLGASALLGSDGRARSVVVDALSRAAFTPLDNSEAAWDASRTAAGQLAADLPTIVVAATGEQSGLAALLSVLRSDLDEILGRLPPAPADRAVCESYLCVLADDLDHSMWTYQAGGRELSLTAVAGRLRATAFPDSGYEAPGTGGNLGDPLELAARCERLVLVGGTGTGKSWLAQRIAISAAEKAAAELVSGGDLASVEIPLFVRCSGAFRRDLPAWDAVVAVALAQIGHRLGSSRLTEALRRRFTEHANRFLVVLDGLDEAADVRDSDLLYRLVTTAGRQLRIVLTTRPDSWRRQLPLDSATELTSEPISCR
jgi:hypothetical protein